VDHREDEGVDPLAPGETVEVYIASTRSRLGDHAFTTIIDRPNVDSVEITGRLQSIKTDVQRGTLGGLVAAFKWLQDHEAQDHDTIIYTDEEHVLGLPLSIGRLAGDRRRNCHDLYQQLLPYLGKEAWSHVALKPQPKDGIHAQRRARALVLARIALGG
jgi:hypothetical protein